MYENTIELARRISKPIVTFDLEHTGSGGDGRAITDFGAMVVTPAGEVSSYASLVKPPDGASFNSYVCRLTGIYPDTVADAPGWAKVLTEFVLPHRDALWVGFNSRVCDTPLVYKESLRLGRPLAPFQQLDLMRVGELEGGLVKRLTHLAPDFDVSGAHRALKDALMTLALLEAQLPYLQRDELDNQLNSIVSPPPATPRPREASRKLDVTKFLVPPGVRRNGQPWSADEVSWVCHHFRGRKKTVEQMAELNGRSAFAIACALFKEGVITEAVKDQYRRQA